MACVDRVADQRVAEQVAVDAVLADAARHPGRVEVVEQVVLVDARDAARAWRGRTAGRPARPTQGGHGLVGKPLEPPGEHVVHGGGGWASASRPDRSPPSRASRAYSTQEERVAVGAGRAARGLTVGRARLAHGLDDARPRRRAEPGRCDPQRVPTGERLDRVEPSASVGSGWLRQVPRTSSRPSWTVSPSRPSTRSEATSAQCRSSSSTSEVVARAASAPHRRWRPRCGTGRRRPRPARVAREVAPEPVEHRWPTATAGVRPRPGSSGRTAPCAARPATAASSASSRLLPMPGSPTSAARAGAASRLRRAAHQLGQLVVRPTSGQGATGGRGRGAGRAGACAGTVATPAATGGGGASRARGPGAAPRPAGRAAPRRARGRARRRARCGPAAARRARRPAGRAGERQRPQRPEPLAQRVAGGERLELGRRRWRAAQVQPGDGPVLERDERATPPAGTARRGERRVLELGVGRAAPQRQRRVQVGHEQLEVGGRAGAPAGTGRGTGAVRRAAGGRSPTAASKQAASRCSAGTCSA